MKRRYLAVIPIALAALGFSAAHAQDYPNRPITLVVPFGAGSGADSVARLLAQHLQPALGAPVVIDNRAGANGAIGATVAARAAPDGYTLLLTSNTTHSVNPSMMRNLAYDPIKDFASIARIGNFVYVLASSPTLQARSVQELVAHAKAHPGDLSYAFGNGTGVVAGATFMHLAGLNALRVPYKSTPPALTDMVAGRVSMMFVDLTSSRSLIEAGSLRALAVSTPARSPIAPDVPSMTEAGMPQFDITAWAALFAPSGTPPEIVARLNAELRKVVGNPEVRKRLADMGLRRLLRDARRTRWICQSRAQEMDRACRDGGAST